MKTKVNPTLVGLFVLGACALGVAALLVFGDVYFFSQPQRFVVYFNESIHGLDLGSPLKLRGVRVGRVVGLNVHYDESSNHSVVAVVCELSKNMITDSKGAVVDVSDRAELQRLIDKGLRAQLGVLGLATGLLFVELDFLDTKEYPAGERGTDVKYAVVPYVPSAISEFQTNLNEILNNVKRVDLPGIGRALKLVLDDTHKQLDGLDLKGLAAQWKKTGASVDALAQTPEIKATFANLDAAVTELRATIAKVDTAVVPAGKELTATLVQAKTAFESFNNTANAARMFIASHSGLGDEVVATLEQLNAAAAAVTRLADFLERNPNALLTGKKLPQ
ncbi:MAG: MCE family protein [Opitutaceae bacterium]|nr:MCE family protein [Opitutaceae bacterium]